MTPLGVYTCCCTAVRGAALRVAASHTITHSQCEQQQGKARPPPLSSDACLPSASSHPRLGQAKGDFRFASPDEEEGPHVWDER
jgi:hypothetical protein